MKKISDGICSFLTAAAPLLYAFIGFALIFVILKSGKWPAGDDVMYHIYRGQKVYEAIGRGTLFPSYDAQWYNGVEILRYWSPLPAYAMAFTQWIAHGDPMEGYLVFTWLVYFLSALSWYFIGLTHHRPSAGALLGAIWFFVPQNVMYYFESGNLAGMSGIACVLPWFIAAVSDYQEKPSACNMWKLALLTALMTFCHSGFALLAMLSAAIWLLLKKAFDHTAENGLQAVFVMLLGFLLSGFWFLASRRGVSAVDYSEQLKNAFQSLQYTLNPLDRTKTSFAHYYFGLSLFVFAVFALLFAPRQYKAGFLTTVLICLLTSTAAYQIIHRLPGGSFLWTNRMISAAVAILFFNMLSWGSLKQWIQIVAAILMILDFIPSTSLIYGNGNNASLSSRFNDEQNAVLLTKAKEITTQRIALIDGSSLASNGAYLTSTWNSDTDSAFGAGYEAAVTRKNITMLNRAANDGAYYYLFDRVKELGCDTVDLQISQLASPNDKDRVKQAAEASGYSLVDENNEYLLYHLDEHGNFGTTVMYRAAAIGTNASEIAEYFPAFKEMDQTDLSAYAFDDLSSYDLIYLDGFTMSDRTKAEDLVTKLSENGTRIIVAADGIPIDRTTRNQTFMNVTCSPIRFSYGYPEMHTDSGTLNLELFPSEERNWNTVYLNGLDHAAGTIEDNGLTLAFAGTVKNNNIVFIGFNLTYFYALTKDPKAEAFLSDMMQISTTELPQRETVPLQIHFTDQGITIQSDKDNVNTSLAFHDIFTSTSPSPIWSDHNLLYVDSGETRIAFHNQYLFPGCLISIAAFVSLCLLQRITKKRDYNKKDKRRQIYV